MLTANLTIETTRRSWNPFLRRRFVLHLPETWAEVTPERRRRRWWRWTATLPQPGAQRAMLRDLIPRRFRRHLSDMDMAALAHQLAWTHAEPQCEQVPLPHLTHLGRMYLFPTPKGENMTCLEFALADDYYKQFLDGDADALLRLSATLWRERDSDGEAGLRRGDHRVRLRDKAEVERRVRILTEAAPEIHLQALCYFGGLKVFVHRVYGNWLFEQPDDDEEEEQQPTTRNQSPDFGWWGIFQQVAESGTFGDIRSVYQAPLHEVCVYLVRKRVEANAAQSSIPQQRTPDPDYD